MELGSGYWPRLQPSRTRVFYPSHVSYYFEFWSSEAHTCPINPFEPTLHSSLLFVDWIRVRYKLEKLHRSGVHDLASLVHSSFLFVLSPAHPALLKAIKPRLFLTIQCFDEWHGKPTPNLQLVFRRTVAFHTSTRGKVLEETSKDLAVTTLAVFIAISS